MENKRQQNSASKVKPKGTTKVLMNEKLSVFYTNADNLLNKKTELQANNMNHWILFEITFCINIIALKVYTAF